MAGIYCKEYFEDRFDEDEYEEPKLRTEEEILKYMDEAFDKVWYMRSRPCAIPEIERARVAHIVRVLLTYKDIPKDGYDDWDCGYWNGILGALRWVLGEEKDFLDT